ncbi:MAG: RHS repeat protein, partial [Gammaproteobacteria bacterium]|nr:RHS repeat protein [Gammaproteobacteria bacterium]
NIKAKDAAGNESENGNLTVIFINDPPEITDIRALNAIMEGLPYIAGIRAKDINHNLKDIEIDWGKSRDAAPVSTFIQASEFVASFIHIYDFGNLPPDFRPSSHILAATAHDEADIASPMELWTVPVLSREAQDNFCVDFVNFKGNLLSRLTADPVDTATGAQLLEHDLLEVQGLLPLSFSLRYNSLLLNREGVTGRGWEDALYNARLEKLPQGHVLARWSVNRVNLFEKDPNGGYLASHSACRFDTLEEQADGSFTLTRNNTSVYRFSPEGRLTALGDQRGRFVHITHDAEGRTAKVTEPVSGVRLEYVYNAAGRLESVRDGSGRTARLQYDGEGRLAAITDAAGQTTAYTYNQHGQILTGTDHEGRLLFSNAYDDKYRILEQDDANPGNLPVRLSYDDDSRPGYRVTAVTDREGHAKVYTTRRDDLQLVSIHKGSGELIVQYDYNADGRRIAAVNANNHRVIYVYDADDDPATLDTIIDAAGQPLSLTYDDRGNLTQIKNAREKSFIIGYDGSSNPVSVTDPLQNTVTYVYNEHGQPLSKRRPGGGETFYTWENGRLAKIAHPDGRQYTLGYDTAGRPASVADIENHATALVYDGAGRVTKIIDPLNHEVSLAWDSRDNLLSFTDANQNTTLFGYDNNGNLVRKVNGQQEIHYQYDGEDRLIKVTDAKTDALIATYAYDDTGRLAAAGDGAGNTRRVEYDPAGNPIKYFDAEGREILSLAYDVRNNPVGISDALQNKTLLDYDELSRLTKITDPLAYAAEFGYDDLDRLIKSLDAMTGESAQSFDADGNRDSLADPNQNRTGFHFDLSGRLIEESSAAGGSVKYAWNARNLLEKLTNARGQERVFQYDAARRLSGFADADGTVSRAYDNNGNLLTVSDESGTITRTYDALNRVTAYTDARGDTIRYAYDSRGRLQTLTYPDDRIVTYAYNAAGRLARVADWAGRETLYTYDANSRLVQTARPDGTQLARVYNAAGQLQQQTDTGPDGELIARFDFTYDAAGDISTEKTLPAAPRLPAVLSAEMSYGAANRLMTYNGEAVRFDTDGNMIHGPLNGGMADFSFDSRNRLTGAGNTQYIYDAENQRIARWANGKPNPCPAGSGLR